MQFNVSISELAEKQYIKILDYLKYRIRNNQAVINVMDDFDETIQLLEENAMSFGLCNDERLRRKGFRKLHFKRHRYLFVYRIIDNDVIIEGLYHELQDYENAIL